jgi:branched-chain amino acid aminotransferase
MTMQIRFERNLNPKAKPTDQTKLGFGQIFTDHMFVMDYVEGNGWMDPRIVPYGPLALDPATSVFHYGQTIFEGLKAYRTANGSIQLFRPHANMKRINLSNDRMVIPVIDEEFAVGAVKKLVDIERDWIPSAPGTSLYIRPFIFATDPYLGVRASKTYKFIVILSPSGAYYPKGLDPVDIFVENHYVRAVKGGTGSAKTAGNYASSLKSQTEAYAKGFVQVLWLDGIERRYIEEVGAMNVFFRFGDELVTPALEGSILPGITRDSVLTLAKSWGLKAAERRITIDEVAEQHDAGRLTEVFGSGTAAVISPVGCLVWNDKRMCLNEGRIGPWSQRFYDALIGIQYGTQPDPFGWIETV